MRVQGPTVAALSEILSVLNLVIYQFLLCLAVKCVYEREDVEWNMVSGTTLHTFPER